MAHLMKRTLPSLLGIPLLALTMSAGVAVGQVQEKKVLNLEGARRVVAAAEAEARRNNAGGAIAVVDDGGHLILLQRLDNTFPSAATVATEKARTAATFRKDTRAFEDAIKGGRVSLVAVDVMTPLQGGVPIIVDGQVVGAVGVSGAASAQQDEDIAKVAAGAVK
ncbi:MAG TPA: heme-binding protein [Candidatus Polarisedimenticolia bacterium]|nr:heme-binding protein [Candidatus Polarisedimenticolia bacterium]